MTDTATSPAVTDDAAVGFVLRLGRALHVYGLSADALEHALLAMCERLGLEAAFFTTPTSIFAAFGAQERQRTHLIRVYPGDVDLGKLARLDAVAREVEAGQVSVLEGSARIDAIMAMPAISKPIVRILAYGVSSAAICRVLAGGLNEVIVAGVAGLLTGAISLASRRLPHGTHVFELVAAFAVSLLVHCVASTSGIRLSIPTATLGGVVALLPGLTVTVAMTELARRHLAAGTARLSGAFLVFIAIAFGVAVGGEVAKLVVGEVRSLAPRRLPEWSLTLALGVAPLAFGVLLRARLRDFPWLWLSSAIGYTTVRLAALSFAPAIAASVGAFVVGVLANLYDRRGYGPASVALVPGLLLLLPGSIGYRSLTSLLDQNVIVGVTAGFTMILTAVAIAGGLLMASVMVPTRPSKSKG
ncbi:MAG: threonine/serine exporter family protein [Acidobacteria bacterium]|nr:threonine/serine exporter family protein [Acidobacteriota bacterium]